MNVSQELEATECCVCGTLFAAPKILIDNRRKIKGKFYCPNGHELTFTDTEVDRLNRVIGYKNTDLNDLSCDLNDAKREIARLKRQLKKAEKAEVTR